MTSWTRARRSRSSPGSSRSSGRPACRRASFSTSRGGARCPSRRISSGSRYRTSSWSATGSILRSATGTSRASVSSIRSCKTRPSGPDPRGARPAELLVLAGPERIDLVADERRLFELEPARGLLHLLLELGDHRGDVLGTFSERRLFAPARGVVGLQARLRTARHAAGDDPVLPVVRDLPLAPAVGGLDRARDRAGDRVGVEDDPALLVPRRAPRRLYEARLAPQEALLVGVQDGDKRDLGQVQPLPQEVDPDERVEVSKPQVAQDLDPLHGIDVGMQVLDPDLRLAQVRRQVLR